MYGECFNCEVHKRYSEAIHDVFEQINKMTDEEWKAAIKETMAKYPDEPKIPSSIDYNYKQVIVVRKDLNMRKGKLAAQVAHASVGSLTKLIAYDEDGDGMSLNIRPDSPMWHWLNGRFVKIVVSCENEEELFKIKLEADNLGTSTVLITDAGFTEFHGVPTNTCLAIGPDTIEKIDFITKHLKLM